MKLKRVFFDGSIYGLVTYFTIRLLLDTVTRMKFWERSWQLNTMEIGVCVIAGWLFVVGQDYLFRYFDAHWAHEFTRKRILKELGVVTVFMLLMQNVLILPIPIFTDDGLQWFDFADVNVIPLLYGYIYYGLKRSNAFLQAYVDNRLKLEKVMNDQLQAELKFLKAQLHPHFLFNALNTIYFQMDEDVSAAKKSVELFSSLIRYQLYDQQQTVPVRQELDYLESFISLQQLRASEKLSLQVSFDPALQEQVIYPLLFFPLVENAFKYVGGEYRLKIKAFLNDSGIVFEAANDIPPVITRTGGIGLENLQRRLELLYPGKHRLEIAQLDSEFKVRLELL
ncbi:sensor histidine kinase [Chitinophaga sancti]|uniref:Histidine kinase n=1 Tax=Chitinophaga sancti TaxID=1004 RepID=A0A1K1SBV3_9BACT|nr:histidine kinase [Chitinophaga sancti]WQD63555.1 histidine kinase [Chitinophaga sancti]WQG90819.1 histidine kinase [Chitinophaga sancti]SFW81706.1 Histidine kinase [Chitinophaga sancti]